MKRPIIGILPRPRKIDDDISILCVSENYRQAVIDFGGTPFLLLPPQPLDYVKTRLSEMPAFTKEEERQFLDWLNLCDGIFLPGGDKMGPYDFLAVKYAIKHDVPILGTCLGMQIMASVLQEIKLEKNAPGTFSHDQVGVDYVHEVKLKLDSKLGNIISRPMVRVNSYHQRHVLNGGIYKVVGESSDGLIEAIEYPDNTFNIGVQWHPERMYHYDEDAKILLAAFFSAAKEKSAQKNAKEKYLNI